MTHIKTLTVYLGSSGRARPVFRDAAIKLGRLIGAHSYRLVYGGMDAGLMGLLATEALNAGAHVTGIIPRKLKDSERMLTTLSETIMVEDLWDRKKRMFLRADAVIGLPGGFGTLDESLEVLYWGKLKLHDKPLVLVNIEKYWDPLIEYLKPLPDFNPRFLITVNKVEDIIPAIESWHKLPPIEEPENLPHFEAEITRATNEPIVIDSASVENTYYAACALGLKQLGRHKRPIGLLNKDGQFDRLVEWLHRAAEEKFITEKCMSLLSTESDPEKLRTALTQQAPITIDLHTEKWGERREKPR